jgi:hypothetical protein
MRSPRSWVRAAGIVAGGPDPEVSERRRRLSNVCRRRSTGDWQDGWGLGTAGSVESATRSGVGWERPHRWDRRFQMGLIGLLVVIILIIILLRLI